MTVRMLQYWNGHSPDDIVTGLSNEAALIAAGYATADLDGANNGRIDDAKLRTDADGSVSLVGKDNNLFPLTNYTGKNGVTYSLANGYLSEKTNIQLNFACTESINDVVWTGGTGTLTLTREVTINGFPTMRVDMPSSCTRVDLGKTSNVIVPSNWDSSINRTFGYAVYYPTIDDIQQVNQNQVYVGDSSYTNYDLLQVNVRGTQHWPGWHIIGYRDGDAAELNPSKIGTLSAGNVSRSKFRVNKDSGAPCTFYIAWGGVLPRESAKIMWTADDGYVNWYTYLRPAAILRGIPWSFGIDRYYIENSVANFMTPTQLRDFLADTSGLFEFYPHGYHNESFSAAGLSKYMANDDTSWEYLQDLGVQNKRLYHPYVQGSYDETTVAEFKLRGVKLCRTVDFANVNKTYKTSIANTQRADSNLRLPIGFSLESGYSLSQGKAAIDKVISTGGTLIIMAHDLVTSGATGLQWLQSNTNLLMEYAKDKELAGLCQNIRASELASQNITA